MNNPRTEPGGDDVARTLYRAAASLEDIWRFVTDPEQIGIDVIRLIQGTAAAETFLAAVAPTILGLRELAREIAPDFLVRVDPDDAAAPEAVPGIAPDKPWPSPEACAVVASALESAAVLVRPEVIMKWTREEAMQAIAYAQAAGSPAGIAAIPPDTDRLGRPDFLTKFPDKAGDSAP